jgi:hypothetical protein
MLGILMGRPNPAVAQTLRKAFGFREEKIEQEMNPCQGVHA